MGAHIPTRRTLVLGAGAVGVAAAAGGYLVVESDMTAYDEAAGRLRAPLAATPGQRDLVRYATLAANSHNTQPWRFALAGDRITILPDLSRRTPVVDPDDHHLFTTLGCATENLVIAAAAAGLAATPEFESADGGRVAVPMMAMKPVAGADFAAIPARQVSRSVYDGKAVPAADLDQLVGATRSDSVDVMVVTEKRKVEAVMALILEGNTIQFTDPAFLAELKSWIRFNPGEALAKGDGLFTATTGNPTVPGWLGRLLFGFLASAESENGKYVDQIRSSAGLVVLVGKEATPANWVECGRAYQRFALKATALGLKHAFVNQAVEVADIRTKLAAELGIPGRRPDLVIRFGNGPAMPRSLRRPVETVLA